MSENTEVPQIPRERLMETLYYQRETICFFSVEVGRRSKGSEIFCKKCEEENMKILLDGFEFVN